MDPLPPAGASAGTGDPDSVAVMPWVVPRLAELLGRDLAATTGAREALVRALSSPGLGPLVGPGAPVVSCLARVVLSGEQ